MHAHPPHSRGRALTIDERLRAPGSHPSRYAMTTTKDNRCRILLTSRLANPLPMRLPCSAPTFPKFFAGLMPGRHSFHSNLARRLRALGSSR